MRVEDLLRGYELDRLTVATLASHSSLQIVHGAKAEGLRTALVVLRGRYWFYSQFSHLVDKFVVVDSWRELCSERVVDELRKLSAVFIPHGSYVEYVGLDCATNLPLPIFGLRTLYRVEANQWAKVSLLREAGIPTPRVYRVGEDFEGVVIAKLPGAKGGRGYFVAKSPQEVVRRVEELVGSGFVKDPSEVLLQEYLIGVTAYFHYFHSPILGRTEILGADIRYESNIDGLRRVPVALSLEIGLEPTFTVVGNIPLVLRESLLPEVLELGMRFVRVTQEKLPPGIVGPFCLESVVDRDLRIRVFEFSGRIVAGTNLYVDGSPYSYLYWGEPMSTGRRVARELRLAVEKGQLDTVLT